MSDDDDKNDTHEAEVIGFPVDHSRRSGNSRVVRLARWFRHLPPALQTLQLLIENDDGRLEVVESYARQQVRPDLASEINEALLAHVEETGHAARGRVRMLDQNDQPIAQREVRMSVPIDPSQPAVRSDGSARDVVTQLQELLQGVMNTHVKSMQHTFNLLARQADANAHLVIELRKQMRRSDTELAAAKAEVAVAMANEEGDGDDKTNAQVIGLLREIVAGHFASKGQANPLAALEAIVGGINGSSEQTGGEMAAQLAKIAKTMGQQ